MGGGEEEGDRLQYFDLLYSRLHQHPQGICDDPGSLEVDHLVYDESLHERQA